MGPEPRQPAHRANPPLGAGSAGQWVLPRCPPFFGARRGIRHPALGISLPFAAPPQPGKPLSPIPEPIGAGDWTQAKVLTGPRGALMWGSHLELCFLHVPFVNGR